MKKKLIFIAVVAVLLLLAGFRYAVVERSDILPEAVRLGLMKWMNIASAEVETGASNPAETNQESILHQPDEQNDSSVEPDTKESSAPDAGDFFVDENAQVALDEPDAEPTDSSGAAEQPSEDTADEPLIQRGDRGDEVKALQQRLRELGFLTGSADGIFGAKTEKAVVDFKDHLYDMAQEELARMQAEQENADEPGAGLETEEEITDDNAQDSQAEEKVRPEFTGEVNEELRRLLNDKAFDEYQGTLRLNSRGAEVKRLQTRLSALGYLTGKADGIYGRKTAQAVTDFQKRHKLTQDGIAGEKTQRTLYSSSAKQQVKAPQQVKNGKYLLKVSTKDQKVYAYAWSDRDNAYTKLVRTMICSTGLADSPTPKGTFRSVGPVVEWGYFPKYDVWAQYLFRIKGPYLFHSVLFDEADESTVKWGSVNKLGSPASHGCIRLKVEDAKWIYKNCAAGTTVTVY